MHDSSYGIALSDAHEELFAALGLSADYQASTGSSLYTVECHIRYLRECPPDSTLTASTMIVAADPKKVRVHTVLLGEDGAPAATGEFLYLHVDTALGVTTAMPVGAFSLLEKMRDAHADLPRPSHLGLGIGASRSSSDR